MSTILVTADALRADHLSQWGYRRNTLPALDRLVDAGTLFESAYANGPHTARSIPSLLTSQYIPGKAFTEGPTIATAFSKAGFTTAGFHSNTAISTRYETVHGFDQYQDFTEDMDESDPDNTLTKPVHYRIYNNIVDVARPVFLQIPGVRCVAKWGHRTFSPPKARHSFTVYVSAADLTNTVISWLDNHADSDFFLWVHYMDPHRPYGLHPDPPAYVNNRPDRDHIKDLMYRAHSKPESLSLTERELIINLYDSDIHYVSTHLNRFFDALQDLDIWDDATIAFTADHGEEFLEHGLFFHRNRPYNELIHVPLVLKPPADVDFPNTIADSRELVDLVPTICNLKNISIPTDLVGMDLYEGSARDIISVGASRHDDRAVAVRSDNWTYIRSHRKRDEIVEELYNRDESSEEMTSIDEDNPEQVKQMRKLVPKTIKTSDLTFSFTVESQEMQDRLEALGYLN